MGAFIPFGILGEAAVNIYIILQISLYEGGALLLSVTSMQKWARPPREDVCARIYVCISPHPQPTQTPGTLLDAGLGLHLYYS